MSLINSQTLGLQLEKVRDKVPLLFQTDDTLLSRIEKRGDVEKVSSRNMRLPIQIGANGSGSQINADGGDLGVGNGTQWDVFTLTPVYFAQPVQITKLAEVSTNSDEKAVENVLKQEVKNNLSYLRTTLESLLNSDGSGTLDTVVSVSGAVITVNNANQFQDQQQIQIYSALGGTLRGGAAVTITSVDSLNKQITLSANAPGGTTAGDLLIINGAPGAANTSLFGVEYFNTTATTGTYLNLSRTAYPGKLITPVVNAQSASLSPAMVRLAKSLIRRSLGVDTSDVDSLIFHANVDMVAAWENTGIVVSQVIQNQLKGDSSQDMLMKNAPETMSGVPLVTSIHAKPNRVDGLNLKHWGRAEAQPIEMMDWGGQTMFPGYGASGGLSANTLFYFWIGFQVFNDSPRSGVFIENLASVSGY
jgi:hypothetical protein